VVVKKIQKGVLFRRKENGNWRWFKIGNENKEVKYIGEIENGEPNGQGTYTWSSGGKYVGEWKNGRRDGQGTFTRPSGTKYVGEFKDGKRNGQGILTFPDGTKFEGEWKNNKPWNGTLYDKDGNIDNLVREGKMK
jgi:hypothetical protein